MRCVPRRTSDIYLRYNTVSEGFGTFCTMFVSVPSGSVRSVQCPYRYRTSRYVQYDVRTGTDTSRYVPYQFRTATGGFGTFGTMFVAIPSALLRSTRCPYGFFRTGLAGKMGMASTRGITKHVHTHSQTHTHTHSRTAAQPDSRTSVTSSTRTAGTYLRPL